MKTFEDLLPGDYLYFINNYDCIEKQSIKNAYNMFTCLYLVLEKDESGNSTLFEMKIPNSNKSSSEYIRQESTACYCIFSDLESLQKEIDHRIENHNLDIQFLQDAKNRLNNNLPLLDKQPF